MDLTYQEPELKVSFCIQSYTTDQNRRLCDNLAMHIKTLEQCFHEDWTLLELIVMTSQSIYLFVFQYSLGFVRC